jgi:ribonuclease D
MIDQALNKLYEYLSELDKAVVVSQIASTLRQKHTEGQSQTHLFQGDLDALTAAKLLKEPFLAVDTETGGLSPVDHKLHLVQIADLNNNVYIIQKPGPHSERLSNVLFDSEAVKVCHWMKFDLMFLLRGLLTDISPGKTWEEDVSTVHTRITNCGDMHLQRFICTKTLNKLLRPGKWSSLKATTRTFLNTEISKQVEHGQWDRETLTEDQLSYAATDVLVLLPILFTQLTEVARKPGLRLKFDYLTKKVQQILINSAILEAHGYTDFLVHTQDDRRCKSPLLRRKEQQDELDDSRNDGDTRGPEATGSSS